jgi:hypothetical protein
MALYSEGPSGYLTTAVGEQTAGPREDHTVRPARGRRDYKLALKTNDGVDVRTAPGEVNKW